MGWRPGRAIAGLATFLVIANAALAESARKGRWRKHFLISAIALAAANILDAHSSLGRYEANPLVRNSQGQFSAGAGFAIKSAGTAGMLLLEVQLMRKKPGLELGKPCALVNFASAGALGAAAIANHRAGRGP